MSERRLRNHELVEEIITTMASSQAPGDFYLRGMEVVCWTIQHAKAHPKLRELGEWARGFNIRVGLSVNRGPRP